MMYGVTAGSTSRRTLKNQKTWRYVIFDQGNLTFKPIILVKPYLFLSCYTAVASLIHDRTNLCTGSTLLGVMLLWNSGRRGGYKKGLVELHKCFNGENKVAILFGTRTW